MTDQQLVEELRKALTPQSAANRILPLVLAGELSRVDANRLFEYMWKVLEQEGGRDG